MSHTRATYEEILTITAWAANVFSGKIKAADGPAEPRGTRLPQVPPFSFTYGGVASSELLPGWESTHTTTTLDQSRVAHISQYKDPKTGLSVQCKAVVYSDYPTVDYVLSFTNSGPDESLLLENVLPLDFRLSVNGDEAVCLHSSRGGVPAPDAFKPASEMLNAGDRRTLSAGGGRSSKNYLPWFNLQWPDGGLLVAVGWSGQWSAEISRDQAVHLTAGMEGGDFLLQAGETFRTPRIVVTHWRGDDHFRGYNLGRHLMIDHYLPRLGDEVIFPPVSKPTPYDELDLRTGESHHNEKNQLEAIRHAAPLGVELYWLDAYWFEGYYPRGLGNWQFPVTQTVRGSFPKGLKPLADAAHEAGMKFILWFGPEVFQPGTYVDRTKPEWTIRLKGEQGGLFNLAIPEAREWMTRYIVETLRAFDVDVCRLDLTRDPLAFWRALDPPQRQGITEVRYMEGLYQMWDDIRKSKPGIWIDNCSSGGQRIDLETCSRSMILWRSDFNDTPERRRDEIGAISDQVMTMGLSLYLPLHAGPVWRPEPYYWRSAMPMGNNIYWDLRPDKETGRYKYDRELTKQAIQECKSLRKYYLGDFYHLTDVSTDSKQWAGYQYIRPEHGDGFAAFFRRPESPRPTLETRLRGLHPDGRYKVTWYWTYDAALTKTLKGTELARLAVEIKDKPGSLLLRFERID